MNDPYKTVDPLPEGPNSTMVVSDRSQLPSKIGRYRIQRVLGKGGFGLVYLGQDEQLNRPVAIKVPHQQILTSLDDADAYLTEARAVAKLDHPHIVPVFDVGSTEQF